MVAKLVEKLLKTVLEGIIGGFVLAAVIWIGAMVYQYPDLVWALVCFFLLILGTASVVSRIRARRWERMSR